MLVSAYVIVIYCMKGLSLNVLLVLYLIVSLEFSAFYKACSQDINYLPLGRVKTLGDLQLVRKDSKIEVIIAG